MEDCKYCDTTLNPQPFRLQVDWYGQKAHKLTYFCPNCGADYMECILDASQRLVWRAWDEPGTNETEQLDNLLA